MMAMPNPTCPKCGKPLKRKSTFGSHYWWICLDTQHGYEISDEKAHEAYIVTLEAELTALRQQVAALQAAQPREPLAIEWIDNSNHLSLDDLIDEELAAGTVAKNATVDQPTE